MLSISVNSVRLGLTLVSRIYSDHREKLYLPASCCTVLGIAT